MIPEYLVSQAVTEFGKKYVFVYPKREWTETDTLSGADMPSGKRLKGYTAHCTACGAVYNYPFAMPPDHLTNKLLKKSERQMCPGNNLITCEACGAEVESRKGWVGKTHLKDRFYVGAWEVISPVEVIFHEAIIFSEDWSRWEEYNGPRQVSAYDLRHTVLTPGRSQSFDRYGVPRRISRSASVAEMTGISITGGYRAILTDAEQFNVMNEDALAGTFLHGIAKAVISDDDIHENGRADYIIRLNEEPITELLFKAGYTALAWARVYKKSPARGTRTVNYSAKSPKKMFRGLKKGGIDKQMLRILRDIDPEARGNYSEWELLWTINLLKDYHPRPDAVTALLSIPKKKLKYSVVDMLIPFWNLDRITEYIRNHDCIMYRDYLRFAAKQGESLAERRVAFPDDLRTAHDDTILREQRTQSTEEQEKVRARCRELTLKGYEYRWRDICTIIPAEADEIIAEGISLSHCVGRYVHEHASGETNIIFIRRVSEPKKPWFTLEVDPDTLEFVQCYGEHNNVSGLPDSDYADEYNPVVGEFLRHYARRLKWGKQNYNKTHRRKGKCRKTA